MLNDPGPLRREPHQHACTPNCGRPLQVLKTVTRDLVGADRLVPVQEVFRYCSRHPSRVLSPDPLTPWKSNYTFALIAEVGRQRFFVHRQFSEIRDELHKGGLPLLPTRSLQHLADRYALLTTAVHLESLQTLAQFLRDRGGYALLIDGTGKAGRMTLQLSDGWSPLVLLSATFPKESREALVPFLRFLDAALGPPVSATRDLSKGIDEALREVWPDLLILSCHQHFLRAEGTKLFKRYFARFRHVVERSGAKKELRALRQRLRQEGGTCREVRQTLAWAEEILSSSRAGKGQGFPFFLAPAEFYRCAERVWKAVEEVLSRPGRRARGAPYRKLQKALKRLFEPRPGSQRMAEDCRRLEERWVWFERLRRVLRFRAGPIPLSTQYRLSKRELKKGLRQQEWLLGRIEEVPGSDRWLKHDLRRMAKDLRERQGELFAPNVVVRAKGRRVMRRAPRTQSLAEAKFRGLRRHGRRVRGNADVEALVQREGPALLLLGNLRWPVYVRMVYGTLSRQGERFAHVSAEALAQARKFTGLSA